RSAGPWVVTGHAAKLLVLTPAGSFGELMPALFTSCTFGPRPAPTVAVSMIVLSAPPGGGAGRLQVSVLPLILVGSGTALPALGVKVRPAGSVSVIVTVFTVSAVLPTFE